MDLDDLLDFYDLFEGKISVFPPCFPPRKLHLTRGSKGSYGLRCSYPIALGKPKGPKDHGTCLWSVAIIDYQPNLSLLECMMPFFWLVCFDGEDSHFD